MRATGQTVVRPGIGEPRGREIDPQFRRGALARPGLGMEAECSRGRQACREKRRDSDCAEAAGHLHPAEHPNRKPTSVEVAFLPLE